MNQLLWPVVLMVLGAFTYAIASPKLSTLGLVTYGCGCLVFAYSLSAHMVHFP